MMWSDNNWERSTTNAPILVVRGLCKDFAERRPFTGTKNTVCAFDEIDLTVRRGTTLAIVGESGCGKSSLARCIALLEQPTRGEMWFEDRNVATLSKRDLKTLRAKIQMIFQDPASALNPAMTAEEIIAEPLAIQGLGTNADHRRRVKELLLAVGLTANSANKRSFEFSGGQKQRLVIARALTLNPKLLVLDEPCSGLDLKTQERIFDLLRHVQTTMGMSFIHISHDLRAVSDFADEIAVMCRGRIMERNSAAEVLNNPQHSYTQELLSAMPSIEAICEHRFAGALQ